MDYEISIENVAEQLNTTTAFVRNAIQQHSGKKYKDYLIFLRIEYAKKLLASDHLTVAETCQKVGYTNISYFIKAFKNQTGVTPANYKNGNWMENFWFHSAATLIILQIQRFIIIKIL